MTNSPRTSRATTIRPTASMAALMPVYVPRAAALPRMPVQRPQPTNFHGVRATVLAVIAAIGFMAAASLAHGAELPTAPAGMVATCTSKTTIRSDGAIVTHKVCTYTQTSSR